MINFPLSPPSSRTGVNQMAKMDWMMMVDGDDNSLNGNF